MGVPLTLTLARSASVAEGAVQNEIPRDRRGQIHRGHAQAVHLSGRPFSALESPRPSSPNTTCIACPKRELVTSLEVVLKARRLEAVRTARSRPRGWRPGRGLQGGCLAANAGRVRDGYGSWLGSPDGRQPPTE